MFSELPGIRKGVQYNSDSISTTTTMETLSTVSEEDAVELALGIVAEKETAAAATGGEGEAAGLSPRAGKGEEERARAAAANAAATAAAAANFEATQSEDEEAVEREQREEGGIISRRISIAFPPSKWEEGRMRRTTSRH